MFRVGILGAENSHAMAFAEIFNGLKPEYAGEFDDIRVVGVGGLYPEANQKVFDRCGLEFLAEKPEDMLGRVDAVMVTARDGKYHMPFARPFIEAGIPAFIDKPFTRDPDEARALVKLAREKGVPLVGGSSVKLTEQVKALKKAAQADDVLSGDLTAPVSMVNDYGGFWFYSAHLVESCLTVFGDQPEWVWAHENNGSITAVLHYPRYDVTNHFLGEGYQYSGTVCAKTGIFHQPISLDGIYGEECRSFARMLRTGEMDFSYEQLVRPICVLKAIETSMATGARCDIPPV